MWVREAFSSKFIDKGALLEGMRIDVHQHLWSEPLVAALAQRRTAPCVRRDGQAWRLSLPAEQSCLIDVVGDEPEHRASLLALDGVDAALIAPSTALGIEGLEKSEKARQQIRDRGLE